MSEIIEFWQRYDLKKPPYIHPDDATILEERWNGYVDSKPCLKFAQFLKSSRFGDFTDTRLHLSLIPVPYGGDLKHAEIVILLLNPGFSYTDYYAETEVPEFRKQLIKNLYQDFKGLEFPFIWLNPAFCWHSGFNWWEKKLRGVLRVIADEKFKGDYLKALQHLAQRIAHLELVPYHSPSFSGHGLIAKLESARTAKAYAQGELLATTKQRKKSVIITRRKADWGLSSSERITVYEGGHTRGASLGPNTAGGRAILKACGIKFP